MLKAAFVLIVTLAFFTANGVCAQSPNSYVAKAGPAAVSNLDQIVAGMVVQGLRQKEDLQGYRAFRRFHAANPKFRSESTLEVLTTFCPPDSFESEVLKQEGSNFIRQRVFEPILEVEKETGTKKEKSNYDILPSNYDFEYVGRQDCDGRPCYQLRISPKQKNKYRLNGNIWVDAEDYAIVRIQGSPSKRVSFWTIRTEIIRQYRKVNCVWLTDRIESVSDIFIAGRSTFSITYDYQEVQTRPKAARRL